MAVLLVAVAALAVALGREIHNDKDSKSKNASGSQGLCTSAACVNAAAAIAAALNTSADPCSDFFQVRPRQAMP